MTQVELTAVLKLLTAAGEEILKIYESGDIGEEIKSDQSPVTKADHASSRLINRELNKLFPTIPVVDEESPIPSFSERRTWKQFFLLDPLDGTREFIRRNGEFCINLALVNRNEPVQGWIYQPVSGTGWYVEKGNGIKEFDTSLKLKDMTTGTEAVDKLRIVTTRSFFNTREEKLIQIVRDAYDAEIIGLGSSLKHIRLAGSEAGLYLKASYSAEWDTAPGQLMIEETGGAVLKFGDFRKLEYNKPDIENPHFIMVSQRFNRPDFIEFLRKTVSE